MHMGPPIIDLPAPLPYETGLSRKNTRICTNENSRTLLVIFHVYKNFVFLRINNLKHSENVNLIKQQQILVKRHRLCANGNVFASFSIVWK